MVVIHGNIARGRKSCCKCFETLFLLKLLSNYLEFTKIVLADLCEVFIKEEMEGNDNKKLVTYMLLLYRMHRAAGISVSP